MTKTEPTVTKTEPTVTKLEPTVNVIRFEQVGHSFEDRVILSEVNLEITEKLVGIIGLNGSGKSTLVRMINGLVLPDRGRVTVNGLNVANEARAVRQQVGFIFTNPDNQIIMPTVVEDVAFSLRRFKLDQVTKQRRIEEVLERFGLSDHHNHPSHSLSGGQKQLLAIAAVLVTEPQILVADEPTTLLDARNTQLISQTLCSLPQQLILVTHQLELLTEFQRVIVIHEGRVFADAPPAEAFRRYQQLVST